MKPPIQFHGEDDPMSNTKFSELPTEEQVLAAKKNNEYMETLRASFMMNESTFSQDSTEVAKQYIESIHSFDEAQDSFFQGFLSKDAETETNNLDDFFKETLI